MWHRPVNYQILYSKSWLSESYRNDISLGFHFLKTKGRTSLQSWFPLHRIFPRKFEQYRIAWFDPLNSFYKLLYHKSLYTKFSIQKVCLSLNSKRFIRCNRSLAAIYSYLASLKRQKTRLNEWMYDLIVVSDSTKYRIAWNIVWNQIHESSLQWKLTNYS
jgi:hypothetical protein